MPDLRRRLAGTAARAGVGPFPTACRPLQRPQRTVERPKKVREWARKWPRQRAQAGAGAGAGAVRGRRRRGAQRSADCSAVGRQTVENMPQNGAHTHGNDVHKYGGKMYISVDIPMNIKVDIVTYVKFSGDLALHFPACPSRDRRQQRLGVVRQCHVAGGFAAGAGAPLCGTSGLSFLGAASAGARARTRACSSA